MRRFLVTALAALALSCLGAGCLRFASAEVVTRWISKKSGLGVIIKQSGDVVNGTIVLLSESVLSSKIGEPGVPGDAFDGSVPIGYAVMRRDGDKPLVLFPLKNNTMVQTNSVEYLLRNNQAYVEFDVAFEGHEIVGRWRNGDGPVKQRRTFIRH